MHNGSGGSGGSVRMALYCLEVSWHPLLVSMTLAGEREVLASLIVPHVGR